MRRTRMIYRLTQEGKRILGIVGVHGGRRRLLVGDPDAKGIRRDRDCPSQRNDHANDISGMANSHADTLLDVGAWHDENERKFLPHPLGITASIIMICVFYSHKQTGYTCPRARNSSFWSTSQAACNKYVR